VTNCRTCGRDDTAAVIGHFSRSIIRMTDNNTEQMDTSEREQWKPDRRAVLRATGAGVVGTGLLSAGTGVGTAISTSVAAQSVYEFQFLDQDSGGQSVLIESFGANRDSIIQIVDSGGNALGTSDVVPGLEEPATRIAISLDHEITENQEVTAVAWLAENGEPAQRYTQDGEPVTRTAQITVEEPEPADFVVSDLEPSDASIEEPADQTVSATITNEGDEEATRTISLMIDGDEIDSTTETLAGGEQTTVEFTIPADAQSFGTTHVFVIDSVDDDAVGTLTIAQEPTPEPTPTPTETLTPTPTETLTPTPTETLTPTPTDSGNDMALAPVLVGLLGLGGAGTLWLARRNGDSSSASTTDDSEDTPPDTSNPASAPGSGKSQGDNPTTQQDIDTKLDEAGTHLSDAKRARDAERYDDALQRCRAALDTARDAREVALSTAPERVSAVDSTLQTASQLRETIEEERDRYQTLTAGLERLDKELDTAEATLDDDPEKALSMLEEILGAIADAEANATKYNFEDIDRRIDRLRERCRELQQRAETATRQTQAPETILSVPRLSLSYDDIEKGEPLGSGGNADVYHATTATPDGDIELALKEPRMSGTLHTDTIERMLEEAETWQQLDDNDHIVSVVDYGSEPLPWIAMEYMDAGHLGERAGKISFEQALWTALAVTRAVRHAHNRGVAHLDLKPTNILFRSVEDAWDVPKVADWGLSKHLLEHSKSVEGMSPHYAAPEQFDSEEYGATDNVTDVYQLGAVFYELFTGRPPFEGKTFEVINKIQSDQPTPPSEVADLPDELDEILLTALATEKENRYEHVLYLRDDLEELWDSY
jgi:hypothetical protein